MVIPFEVVDHQDLWFNVPYISSKATHKLPNILRKKKIQEIDPMRVICYFFVFAIPSTRTPPWWVNWASFLETLSTLFKLPSSRIHEYRHIHSHNKPSKLFHYFKASKIQNQHTIANREQKKSTCPFSWRLLHPPSYKSYGSLFEPYLLDSILVTTTLPPLVILEPSSKFSTKIAYTKQVLVIQMVAMPS